MKTDEYAAPLKKPRSTIIYRKMGRGVNQYLQWVTQAHFQSLRPVHFHQAVQLPLASMIIE